MKMNRESMINYNGLNIVAMTCCLEHLCPIIPSARCAYNILLNDSTTQEQLNKMYKVYGHKVIINICYKLIQLL